MIDPAVEKARCKADAVYKERQDEKDKKRKAGIAERRLAMESVHAAAEAKRQLEQQEAQNAEDAAKRAQDVAKAKRKHHAEELEGARLEAEAAERLWTRRQAEAEALVNARAAAATAKKSEDALKATPVKSLRLPPLSEAEVSALSPKQLRAEVER
jgi:hypothetical protein